MSGKPPSQDQRLLDAVTARDSGRICPSRQRNGAIPQDRSGPAIRRGRSPSSRERNACHQQRSSWPGDPVAGQQRRKRSLVAGAHTAEEPHGERLLLTRHLEERTREATSIQGIATELLDALETPQGGRLWGERQD